MFKTLERVRHMTACQGRSARIETPVLLLIFNRPALTRRVFAEIAKVRPKKLFVVADGPRPDRSNDFALCAATRAVVEQIDWDCELVKNYADANVGCGKRVASGISWVFDQAEEAIILEDDCVPHSSFFHFCEEMLQHYRDDRRVMHIAGSNYRSDLRKLAASYSFLTQVSCWGWATWRRAWQHYDLRINQWPSLKPTEWLSNLLGDPRLVQYYENIFERAHAENVDKWTWDYQWAFACWANSGLAIQPSVNLISNIGFGEHATHTTGADHKLARLPVEEIAFPLVHPPCVSRDIEADRIFNNEAVLPCLQSSETMYQKLRRKAVEALPDRTRSTLVAMRDSVRRRVLGSTAALSLGMDTALWLADVPSLLP